LLTRKKSGLQKEEKKSGNRKVFSITGTQRKLKSAFWGLREKKNASIAIPGVGGTKGKGGGRKRKKRGVPLNLNVLLHAHKEGTSYEERGKKTFTYKPIADRVIFCC